MKDISQEKMTASRLPVSRFAHSFLLALLTALFYGISAHGGALKSPTLGETKNAATQSATTQNTANPSPATLVASDESKVTSSKTAQAPLTPQPNSIASPKPQRKDSPDSQYTVYTYIVGGPGHYSTRITILEKLTEQSFQTVPFPGGISEVQWLPKSASVVYMARARADSPVHLYLADAKSHLTRDLTPFAGTTVQRYTVSTTSPSVIAYLDLEKRGTYQPVLIDTANGATEPLSTSKLLNQALARMKQVTTVESAPERQQRNVASFSGTSDRRGTQKFSSYGYFNPAQDGIPRFTVSGQDKYKDRLKGQAEQRILFLTPKDRPGEHLKSFTEEEKKIVVRTWQWVCDTVPGLALRASRNDRLCLARIDKDEFYSSLDEKKEESAAQARFNEIVLTDIFFSATAFNRCRTLVHEVTHEADVGSHLSLSQQWLTFIDEKVPELQAALKFSRKHGIVALDDYGAKYFGLPSLYAAEQPEESLAEWTTAYIFGSVTTPPNIRQFLEQKILDPDCQEAKFEEKFIRAVYDQDIDKLKEVIRADSDFLQARFYLVRTYRNKKDYKQALAVSDELLKKIDSRKIYRIGTNARAFAYFQHGDTLCGLNRYGEAQVFLNKAIALEPHNEEFLSAQRWMDNHRKNPESRKKA